MRELIIERIKELIDKWNSFSADPEPYLNYDSMSDETLLEEYSKWTCYLYENKIV